MLRTIIILSLLTTLACGGGKGKQTQPSGDGTNALTLCTDIKVQADCTPTKIAGKKCMWMANGCIEETAELQTFMSEERKFSFDTSGDTVAWGNDHQAAPNWIAICKYPSSLNNQAFNIVNNITMTFTKQTDNVVITLMCESDPEGTNPENTTFPFKYRASKVDNDNLLITIELNGQDMQGAWEGDRAGNLLEFFSKTDWLYVKSTNSIIAINQLAKNGYTQVNGNPNKSMTLTNKSEFDQARAYQNTDRNHYLIAPDVAAISFILQGPTAAPAQAAGGRGERGRGDED